MSLTKHMLKQGMFKFTLQPGGQSDMVGCYSGLKIDECNLNSSVSFD